MAAFGDGSKRLKVTQAPPIIKPSKDDPPPKSKGRTRIAGLTAIGLCGLGIWFYLQPPVPSEAQALAPGPATASQRSTADIPTVVRNDPAIQERIARLERRLEELTKQPPVVITVAPATPAVSSVPNFLKEPTQIVAAPQPPPEVRKLPVPPPAAAKVRLEVARVVTINKPAPTQRASPQPKRMTREEIIRRREDLNPDDIHPKTGLVYRKQWCLDDPPPSKWCRAS